jgi:hypothetical protein
MFLGTPSHQEAERVKLLKIDMHVQYFIQQLLGGSSREEEANRTSRTADFSSTDVLCLCNVNV